MQGEGADIMLDLHVIRSQSVSFTWGFLTANFSSLFHASSRSWIWDSNLQCVWSVGRGSIIILACYIRNWINTLSFLSGLLRSCCSYCQISKGCFAACVWRCSTPRPTSDQTFTVSSETRASTTCSHTGDVVRTFEMANYTLFWFLKDLFFRCVWWHLLF